MALPSTANILDAGTDTRTYFIKAVCVDMNTVFYQTPSGFGISCKIRCVFPDDAKIMIGVYGCSPIHQIHILIFELIKKMHHCLPAIHMFWFPII